jgi:2-methylcitrate dehydratase
VFAALLGAQGFTGAPEAIDGFYGLAHVLGHFTPRLPVMPGGPSVIEMSHLKPWPAESQVLGLLGVVPEVRDWAGTTPFEAIDVEMSRRASRHVADPAKYDPRNRETADHSLPYMVAVALTDGVVTLDSYRPDRFLDPALRPLMRRITVRPNAEFDKVRGEFHGVTRAHPVRARFRLADGREKTYDLRYHKGHYRDPMTVDDIDAKFDQACDGVIETATRDAIRAEWWDLALARDVADLMGRLGRLDARQAKAGSPAGAGSTPGTRS